LALELKRMQGTTGVHQNSHTAELGQWSGMNTTRCGEDRLWHAGIVLLAMHKLTDSGTRCLNPTHTWGQFGQISTMGRVEIEHQIGLGEEIAPFGLLIGSACDGIVMVGGVARWWDEIGAIDDMQARANGADLLDVFRFKVSCNQQIERVGGGWCWHGLQSLL
jgi:hypothetical protein